MNVGPILARSGFAACFLAVCPAVTASAGEPPELGLDGRFAGVVQPFLRNHCLGCHGRSKQEAKLDLGRFSSLAAVVKELPTWELVLERLAADEMPPEDAPRQPTAHERRVVVEWIRTLRDDEARRNADDPGRVPARRLSNAEFDYTIRDLTGADIRPTREFPVDPANEAGFDNSGESLTMSPALLKKHLAAVRLVADHLVLKPQGFVFAPHPVVADTDRDKYCVARIIDFYRRHEIDYTDYFLAAWRFRHRADLGRPGASLADFAADEGLSDKYLAMVWSVLAEATPADRPEQTRLSGSPDANGMNSVLLLAALQAMWRELTADANQIDDVRRGCRQMCEFVLKSRAQLVRPLEKVQVKGISDGSQTLVLWHNRQLAAQRLSYVPDLAEQLSDKVRSDRERFCRVFPDAFCVTDRGLYSDPKGAGQGRLLTAGFHLMQGYFRDDRPLVELVLDDDQRGELDSLWQELNFITSVPTRQYQDFVFFERAEPPRFMFGAEFDFARSEDKDVASEAKIEQLAVAYLAKARDNGASDKAVEAIQGYFANISAEVRWVEEARRKAEPSHLEALQEFTERAYRRPLTLAERDDLVAFYRSLREQHGLGHTEALRDTLAGVLLSPQFCYRVDLAEAGEAARPLSDYELASRLSYFLWSSMPDAELMTHAAAGDLHRPEVLVAQARRMLGNRRVLGLATEFAGNWLEFRRFEEHNAVDRERFTRFTNELRQAMYEEPIRFFADVASHDRSVLDFLYGEHTFVNPVLAEHYGMPSVAASPSDWVRVDDADRYGRGGLLPMAVFLTRNSPGLRTSPVKRGYWVVRRLLGERIPAPPPEVPELPKDEAKTEATLPQLLARHREHKSCAACHERFDSIGLVFEGYGPIGERREKDLGGRPVDAKATFPDGSEGMGPDGLRRYLRNERQAEFIDNLCRKLLAYALGRGVVLSDQATLEQMRGRLEADDYRFGGLIETIVTSPQFLNKRGRDDPRE
ncbi:MAG TPA: DUF1592 domain-containing protein [Pirellulales bacterium]|nr:DUF1592 domain-containing protein [Pirellulales bacterium]